MSVEFVDKKPRNALPIHLVAKDGLMAGELASSSIAWAKANGFSGEAGRTLIVPGENGAVAGALFGTGDGEGALAIGALARTLPEGDWHFASAPVNPELASSPATARSRARHCVFRCLPAPMRRVFVASPTPFS
jgi:leucyl aminopeptidase